MKTKCYNCGFKNEQHVYQCEKCGEKFWESKAKYNQYLKDEKEKFKRPESHEPEIIDYKEARKACRVPFIFWILYATSTIAKAIWGDVLSTVLPILRGLILTLILLWIKKLVIKYAERKKKSETFVNIIVFSSLILVYLIPYWLVLLFWQ